MVKLINLKQTVYIFFPIRLKATSSSWCLWKFAALWSEHRALSCNGSCILRTIGMRQFSKIPEMWWTYLLRWRSEASFSYSFRRSCSDFLPWSNQGKVFHSTWCYGCRFRSENWILLKMLMGGIDLSKSRTSLGLCVVERLLSEAAMTRQFR